MAQQDTFAFTLSQVAHIEQQVYKTKYPTIQYPNLVDVDTSAWEYADSIVHFSQDMTGEPAWMNPDATDMPFVDLTRDRFSVRAEMGWLGYRFNEKEVAQAMKVPGLNLRPDKAMAVREAYERFLDRIVLNGNTDYNWDSFIDASGVTSATAANDADDSSPLWSNKTPDEVLKDINDALTGIYSGTLQVEMADTICLSVARYSDLVSTRLTDTSMTIFDYIKRANIYTAETGNDLTIRAVRGLEDAGDGGGQRMIAYRKDPEVVRLHLPQPLKFWPMYRSSALVYEIPATFNCGGLEIRRKGAFRYVDGI